MIKKVNTFYWTLINFSTNFTRVVEVFEEIPEIKNYEEWKEYKYKSWEIKIKNLSYKYPDWKQVFEKLSLEIPEKSKIAFIWKSWSWKSTLVKLSWWERQRLAIARLFLQNPNIIILDEPTSALDSFSEDSISKALDNLSKWKTMITIAHRLQTIKKSDKIFIFENWKIIDSWNHKYLLKKSET